MTIQELITLLTHAGEVIGRDSTAQIESWGRGEYDILAVLAHKEKDGKPAHATIYTRRHAK